MNYWRRTRWVLLSKHMWQTSDLFLLLSILIFQTIQSSPVRAIHMKHLSFSCYMIYIIFVKQRYIKSQPSQQYPCMMPKVPSASWHWPVISVISLTETFRLRSWHGWVITHLLIYRQVSNIRRTKSKHLKDSRTVLRLSLPNPLKPDVKSRMKRRQAMLQLHLSDLQFYCRVGCVLY